MSDIVDLLDSSSAENCSSPFNVQLEDEIEETPFQSLIRLHTSYSNYNERKNAVKYIVDALRSVNEVEQLEEILACTKKLADDIVTQVQIDCLEKFVPIIEYLVQNVENGDLLIKEYLFQSIVQTIANGNNRIRKASQGALIRLFELEQIKAEQIEEEILPSLCQLDRASDDFKNEAILLLTRLTQYVSNDLVLKYFVPTIVDQSSSIAFQTRKTCATALGDLTSVIPRSAVDQYLIGCFCSLCSDPFWGVRKSCAEVIHPLAQVCSEESRWNVLSPCLIQLLQDQSRWVKTAALRVLGYFISTFARQHKSQGEEEEVEEVEEEEEEIRPLEKVEMEEGSQFNDFFFWRNSIDLPENDPTTSNDSSEVKENFLQRSKRFARDDVQSILPLELLDSYRHLIDQSYSSGVETDIVHQGAHTFPAVALTLTQHNWHLIRDIHRKFAEDLQWKVRRTLSYSLHALGEILLVEQVEEDLCPVFDSFLRDVDEVKIGLLTHLAQFLELLHPQTRRLYLDKLTYLTSLDNQRNWRFRLESANQIYELTSLFSSLDIADYLGPLAFGLAIDKVADVRLAAIRALSGCYGKYALEKSDVPLEIFLSDCSRLFAQSEDWKSRQSFIFLVEQIFIDYCRSSPFPSSSWMDEFVSRFLSKVLLLREDPVVNVRLSLGTFLSEHFLRQECSKELSEVWRSEVDQCVQLLAKDRDRDVRFSVGITDRSTSHQSIQSIDNQLEQTNLSSKEISSSSS